jgi:hypothetical protein
MKNKLTKKEARAQKAAWSKAVAEGRVVRIASDSIVGKQYSARSYPTAQAAAEACCDLVGAGFEANIVGT